MADDSKPNKIQALLSFIRPFEPDCDNLYEAWHRWMTAFGHFLIAAKIDVDKEQKSWMLLVGGAGLQNVDLILNKHYKQFKPSDKQTTDVYKECTDRFTRYFYERDRIGKFKNIKQESDENFDNFLMRLLALLDSCRFVKPQDELKTQISIGAKDFQVRTKAQESHIDVNEVIKYARNLEKIDKGLRMIRERSEVRETVSTEEKKETEELKQPQPLDVELVKVDEPAVKIEVVSPEQEQKTDESPHDHTSKRRHEKSPRKHRHRSKSPKKHRRRSRSPGHSRTRRSESRDRVKIKECRTVKNVKNVRHLPHNEHVHRQYSEYKARRRNKVGPRCTHCGRFNHVEEFCFFKNYCRSARPK